ncbi:PhrA family quorum-sensing system peptide [Streptococcus gordonii]|uniref:PhrA family quorum-sensing system peptide n=1 Tax=Streptococcus gordonii TaxID=1302 RepID=UPI0021D81DD6|nr:PhrA family quorum-sensing system peptide [Streptococcus gordonii]
MKKYHRFQRLVTFLLLGTLIFANIPSYRQGTLKNKFPEIKILSEKKDNNGLDVGKAD